MLEECVAAHCCITSDEPVAVFVRVLDAVPNFTMEAEEGFCASMPLPV